MSMSENELNYIVQNEIEWRKQLWKKMENHESELHEFKKELYEFKVDMTKITTTLKVKIGISGGFFGFIGGAIVAIIVALIK